MTLTVSSYAGNIIRLTWIEGRVSMVHVDDRVRGDVTRIVEDGLHEWVSDGDAAVPRTTPPSDPEFLPRLKSYLQKQFHSFFYDISGDS